MQEQESLSEEETALLEALEGVECNFGKSSGDEDWEGLYATIREGITHRQTPIRKAAFQALVYTLWNETLAKKLDLGRQYQTRLIPVLDLIFDSDDRYRDLDLLLGKLSHSEKPVYQPIFDWLESHRPEANREAWGDVILAFKLKAEYWRDCPRKLARILIKTLDHKNDQLRARAAGLLGKYARRLEKPENVRWLGKLLRRIARNEIERPGIAGPFLDAMIRPESFGQCIPGFNIKDWVLDILEQRKRPEPWIEEQPHLSMYFIAHELLSMDPWAVRRLIDMGDPWLAVEAATEEFWPVEGMRPLLEELGDNSELGIGRRAAWHLAYHYGFLHSNGHQLGVVDMVDRFPEIDLFIVIRVDFETCKPPSPYAAILYPKERGQALGDAAAWDWINRLLPPPYRSEAEPLSPDRLEERERYTWGDEMAVAYDFSKGFIYFCGDPDAKRWSRVQLGLRGEDGWNPREIIADEDGCTPS